MAKTFISITSEIYKGKLVYLKASSGDALSIANGITFDKAIEFLFSLLKYRKRKSGVVFVCYGFSRDNEFIFSTMSKENRNKLFQSHTVTKQLDALAEENEDFDDVLYNSKLKDSQDYEQADFGKYVNTLAIKELLEVKHGDYKISLANGKKLTISKGGKSLTLYDIYSFFKPTSLRSAVKQWLDKDLPLLDRTEFNAMPILEQGELEQLKTHAEIELSAIHELAVKLNTELEKININLQSYHGATAVMNAILGKAKAKSQFHNYKFKRQFSPENWKAINQAFYGGRAEQFKIGTVNNVKVYDINSAYAFASSFLPVMLTKFHFVKQWKSEPFSIWFCEYDFTDINPYFGLLPNRDVGNAIRYKLRGSSYFWQPEVSFILQHYPNCINIKKGFVLDYERAPFTKFVELFYRLRVELQQQNNPLEKVLKLALAALYGKFCQHNGKSPFYNLSYAGFITSVARRQLLEATLGNESATACFLTDAIHTTAKLNVPVSNELGEYKLTEYEKVVYLDNGVYQCYNGGQIVKTKTKGFRNFDFNTALKQLDEKKTYTGLAEFFVGHNLHELHTFINAGYLEDYAQNKTQNPINSLVRKFENWNCNLLDSYLDSNTINLFNGSESGLYKKSNFKDCDMALDTIEARRI